MSRKRTELGERAERDDGNNREVGREDLDSPRKEKLDKRRDECLWTVVRSKSS